MELAKVDLEKMIPKVGVVVKLLKVQKVAWSYIHLYHIFNSLATCCVVYYSLCVVLYLIACRVVYCSSLHVVLYL